MRTRCLFCGEVLDADAAGVYQYVRGWERRRTGGGTNAIRLPTRENKWACHACIEARVHSYADITPLF